MPGLARAALLVAQLLLDRHHDTGDDQVSTGLERRSEHRVDVVVQKPMAQMSGGNLWDENDDLIIGLLSHLVDERNYRIDNRRILRMENLETHAGIPSPPL